MVGYIAQPMVVEEEEEQDQDSKIRYPKYPLDPLDPSFPDFSFVDSILDFDSMDFLEDNSELDRGSSNKIEKINEMGDKESCSETPSIDQVSDLIVKEEPLELEKEENLGPSIEEQMGRFGFNGSAADSVNAIIVKSELEDDQMLMNVVNELGNCLVAAFTADGDDVKADDNGTNDDDDDDDRRDSESGEESNSSSSSSSDSSSDSDSSSSGDDADERDKDEVEGKKEKENATVELKAELEEGDIEEGEIRDVNREEMAENTVEEESAEDGDKMVEWSDVEFGDVDEEEEGVGLVPEPIKSKNELKILPPVPPVNATLQPHHQMLPVGYVLSTLGAQVIVEGTEKHNPLNEGSILWITEKRTPLGLVDEIFGPVQKPYYVVRYNSESEVPAGIHQGALISFVPEFAQHVLNDKDLYKKGYDASGENDEELTDEAEFSDDEKEAEYKKMQKMSKRGMDNQPSGSKRNNRNKNKNRKGNWNNNMSSNAGQQPSNHNQHNASAAPSMNNGSSSTMGNEFKSGAGSFPPFPPMVPTNGIFQPSNGSWLNALPSQQPTGAFIPGGFPANNMPWPAQNQPFQQPFNLSQGSLPSGVLPGGQMNFCAGPSTWPSMAGFNQSLLGMGFQMQPTLPIMNLGVQGIMHNQPQGQQNSNLQPRVQQNSNLQLSGDSQAPQHFNFGPSSSRGRKPYRRGGGRFSGGRGH